MSTAVTKQTPRELLSELDQLTGAPGAGTSLISLYLPPDDNINLRITELTKELGSASNIKSSGNRTAVQSSLKSIIGTLKSRTNRKVGESGLVIFAGEKLKVSYNSEGSDSTHQTQQQLRSKLCLVIEPDKDLFPNTTSVDIKSTTAAVAAITRYRYICDKIFYTNDLWRIVQNNESKDKYGIIVVDGSGCCIAMVEVPTNNVNNSLHSSAAFTTKASQWV